MAAAPVAVAASGPVVASPRARATAQAMGVDVRGVAGTGPNGRIVEADVKEYTPAVFAPATTMAAAPGSVAFEDVPHSQIRRVTAARLLESKQTVPHYYLTVDIHMEQLMKARQELPVKVSVNDFVIKATALACRDVPEVNAAWTENAMRRYSNIDVNVAVQAPAGLFVPIVWGADQKGLSQISGEVRSLAEKARENKLMPEDYTGGTITVSNLGMFGIKQFSAIINPPQAAILAIGATQPDTQLMSVTASFDHRVVDGAVGAQYLQAFKEYLHSPLKMIV